MRHRKARFVVADPSLADARGHHFSLSLQVARGARQNNCDVVWLTHVDFVLPPGLDGVTVHPVFSSTMYDRYRPENRGRQMVGAEHNLLTELIEGVQRADLCSADHVFFHTGYGDLYRVLPRYLEATDWRDGPFLHVCTPYDLETMPGRLPGTDLESIFRSIRTWEAVDKKLFFWAETQLLATHYTATFGFNVRAQPLPVPAPLTDGAEFQENEPVTVLYLGAAREEKGFLHLPELADRLYETYGRHGKLRFVIQCTPQIIGYQPNIKQAIERLGNYPSDYVELIDVGLSEEEYFSLLRKADVVLLLYNQKNYRIRGSGIAVEAVCANKCLLTHRGTYCASLITEGGGAAVDSIDEAAESLGRLVVQRADFQQKAAQQGSRYRSANSTKNYVDRILENANCKVPFFPGSIVGHVSPTLLSW